MGLREVMEQLCAFEPLKRVHKKQRTAFAAGTDPATQAIMNAAEQSTQACQGADTNTYWASWTYSEFKR